MAEVAENTSAEAGSEETVSTEFDGNLGDGWMEKYGVAEDLRGDQTLQTTKHIGALASQLVNAQKMIGKNTTSIPNEDSPQTEWDAFHDNFRPATAGDYTFDHAEGIGEIDEALETQMKDFFHAEGLRKSTVDKLVALDDTRIMGMRQALADAQDKKLADAETALKTQWGSAYDERLHLANRMVNDNTTDETKQQILDEMGNNPVIANFLADIASKFVEHKIIDATITQNTPIDALAKADELRNTPGYISGELANTSPSRYKQITLEISALMEEAYPEQK